MNTKLIAVGLGAFSYGALVAWAVTADRILVPHTARTMAELALPG